MNSGPAPSIPSLLRDLRDETTTLLRQEAALAKEEISARATELVGQLVQMAAGALVLGAGALLLLFGLADLVAMLLVRAGLDEITATWVARAGLGLLVGLGGALLFARAQRRFSLGRLVPQQTLASLAENKQWAERKLPATP